MGRVGERGIEKGESEGIEREGEGERVVREREGEIGGE